MLVAVIEGLITVPDTDARGTAEGRAPVRRMLIVRINYIGGKLSLFVTARGVPDLDRLVFHLSIGTGMKIN